MPVYHDVELTELVRNGVEETLQMARTWLAWDGRPCIGEDPSRIYTPHKSLRRYADHLIDHLAQIEALNAGAATHPDGWHGSLVTTDADWARFTEVDLDEAAQRLRRLAQLYAVRLGALRAAAYDASHGPEWTIRQIVEHVAEPWYARQIGSLTTTPGT